MKYYVLLYLIGFSNSICVILKIQMAAPDDNLNDNIGPIRWSETWLKLVGFVREKYCSGWLMNSVC